MSWVVCDAQWAISADRRREQRARSRRYYQINSKLMICWMLKDMNYEDQILYHVKFHNTNDKKKA